MSKYIFSVFMILLAQSCGTDTPTAKLPNTPETVVLKWQEYIDKNMFDSARALSMDQALVFINTSLAPLSDVEPLEEDLNEILGLTCKSEGSDKMVCDYYFEDEGGFQFPGRLHLTKEEGQWKVSLTEEMDNSALDSLLDAEAEDIFFLGEGDTLEFE